MTALSSTRVFTVLGTAVLLTTLVELFYLGAWGMLLFPQDSLVGKAVWTLTCGLAMGAVIGAGTLVWVEPRLRGNAALWRAALIVAVVGSYCAWLCSQIDIRIGYFGGPENNGLFIAAGVIPALVGGPLYGWLQYGRTRIPVLSRGSE
ncbi:hypothetical protein FGK63_02740 [Ruegeria sediminis]|uniref:Uncharacterized protein n=1 Tax=Ruegeria sediminis TaxID=2583820 RepID=A0ABY2X4V6_9RHOB|nr:hypothetical protein [Ruegeria sediminis]TMV09999.1 hypothetical protein FGK63_02740 [Ruegeria sediminis]